MNYRRKPLLFFNIQSVQQLVLPSDQHSQLTVGEADVFRDSAPWYI
jgi:hypothetical protein